MLKPLDEVNAQSPERQYPCECCGKATPESLTFSLALVYRMPGPGVAAFQCPAEQHFACSHDHAKQVMLACLAEHIEPLHQQLQAERANRKV